jgi:hypothetical protein
MLCQALSRGSKALQILESGLKGPKKHEKIACFLTMSFVLSGNEEECIKNYLSNC